MRIVVVISTFLALAAAPYAGESAIALSAIHARLFYHHSGSFSDDITTGKIGLWNTVIDGGDAREPSSSVLVDVVVTGRPGTFDPNWLVRLSVVESDSSAVVLKQEKHLGVLSPQGSYHCGFWLAEVGCEALTLTATIAGSSAEQRATIPFRCGE